MLTAMAFADAVIVAAGSSRRMGGVDKLSADLDGRSLLEWATTAMAAASSVRRVVLVAVADRGPELSAERWVRAMGATVVPGGDRRQDSVAAGVDRCDAEVVLVHDAARPFPSVVLIDAVANAARTNGAAIPVLAVVDSLKRIGPSGTAIAAERDGLLRAQTPQGARRETLATAFATLGATGQTFGDEASLLEAHGVDVATVPGEPTNLKVTEPGDLELARAIAALRSGPPRYATASDTHAFGPDDGLALGGITIPEAPRLSGHSDGDVVLHAIADAMLAAAGMADLGRQFPASDTSTKGVGSAELLRILVDRITDAGWRARSADVTILGARPHLGGRRLDAMRQAVADLLGLAVADVGVKASTGNLVGPEGAGSVITASALVAISRR